MWFFDQLFGGNEISEQHPDIKFGRYSDAYKNTAQYDAWDLALEKFEQEHYIESYKAFFDYLRDEKEDNVKWQEKEGKLHFEILQGSKKLLGVAGENKLRLEVKLAVADQLNISFMRRLLELNFDLKYSRYALDDQNDITMIFDTYALDGSPYKLYYALKEVATKADKLDDLLIDEYKMLRASDPSLQKTIPETEKVIKFNFIINEIKEVFFVVDDSGLDENQYPGAVGYLLLSLCYKLDYLIQPEGFMMESLERIHRLYFAKDDKKLAEKNFILRKEFQKLLDRSRSDYFKEMYRVNSTFGITIPVNHDRIRNFIDGELHRMDWYLEHGHQQYALAIPGFIIGYCLFYYAMPSPVRDYFEFYYRILDPGYYNSLGFTPDYLNKKEQKFDRKLIKNKIKAIAAKYGKSYTKLNPNTSMLKFGSMAEFAKSYLQMIYNLDTSKI